MHEGSKKAIFAAFFANLGIAIVLEPFSFRTAIREANQVRHGRGWWEFIRTSKSPEPPVVLLEDLGALVGVYLEPDEYRQPSSGALRGTPRDG